jgi:hypothetical protein
MSLIAQILRLSRPPGLGVNEGAVVYGSPPLLDGSTRPSNWEEAPRPPLLRWDEARLRRAVRSRQLLLHAKAEVGAGQKRTERRWHTEWDTPSVIGRITVGVLAAALVAVAGCGSSTSDHPAEQAKAQQIKDQVQRIQQAVAEHQTSDGGDEVPASSCPDAVAALREAGRPVPDQFGPGCPSPDQIRKYLDHPLPSATPPPPILRQALSEGRIREGQDPSTYPPDVKKAIKEWKAHNACIRPASPTSAATPPPPGTDPEARCTGKSSFRHQGHAQGHQATRG